MPKRIPQELEQKILSLYKKSNSGKAIAKMLGVGDTTVYRVLDRNGIEHRKSDAYERMRKIPASEYAGIISLYESGASLNEIADKFRCAPWTIGQVLVRKGIKPRARGRTFVEIDDDTISEIARLYKDDYVSQTALAKRFSLTQSNISRILRRKGIQSPRRTYSRERHGGWKGGRVVMGNGYIGILLPPDDPMFSMAGRSCYIPEHRLVMARHLGRPLERHETVHHINGDTSDNRIENLQLRSGKHGRNIAYRCADCGSYNVVSIELGNTES